MNYSKLKSALLAISLIGMLTANAQSIDTVVQKNNSKLLYKKYMQKRSTYMTIGWVLVGTGVALPVISYSVDAAKGWNGHTELNWMFEVGIVSLGLSIPFFIIAGANKRKAKLAVKGERLTSSIMFRQTYPALSLSIDL